MKKFMSLISEHKLKFFYLEKLSIIFFILFITEIVFYMYLSCVFFKLKKNFFFKPQGPLVCLSTIVVNLLKIA